MKLQNSFEVPVPVEEAWPVLLDIERIAPCLPGATLEGAEGDEYTGKVRIKAGPVTVNYAGRLRMHDVDEESRSVVLDAQGKEQRGSGTVKADIAARVVPADGQSARVLLETDLAITGKPAQLGRGLIADVSAKIIEQFANNLAREMTGPPVDADTAVHGAPDVPPGTATGPTAAPAPAPPAAADSLDMLELLRPHLLRAAAGAGILVLVVVVLKKLCGR
jgi:carbon monoxide dehydrogenase subunit G